MKKFLPLTVAALFPLSGLHADVTLPPLISDNMLLQQPNAAVWGKADPGENVTVTLGEISASATADKDGNWKVTLEGLKPGAAGTLSVKGKNTLTVQNVLVGEVWVGSGQSNMQWIVQNSQNAEQEIAAANYPEIRMFTVPNVVADSPQKDLPTRSGWQICTPSTVKSWSAVGYFFARSLHQGQKTPVGIIHTSWGGTRAEAWTPKETIAENPDLSAINKEWERTLAQIEQKKKGYPQQLAEWEKAAEAARAANQPEPKRPGEPIVAVQQAPGALYNAMIHGATPYTIKGVIWYQGESNVGNATRYRTLLKSLIQSWRKNWGLGDFPFLIVQLAGYRPVLAQPYDSALADLRDAQRLVSEELPNSGLAVALDIGDPGDIHPRNKQEVGRRLALIAEARVYGKPVVYSGPAFDSADFHGNTVKVHFKPGTAAGLAASDGAPIKGFAVAGEDKKFFWAEAKIVPPQAGKEPILVVTAPPEVPTPVALRYAWADSPEINLVNGDGLPASSFHTDNWPMGSSKK